MITDTAVLLAGGFGTRLAPLNNETHKALVPIAGQPFLSLLLAKLVSAGVRYVHICAGFRGDEIERYLCSAEWPELNIQLHIETGQLGTGGAVRRILHALPVTFLVAYGDIYWTDGSLDAFLSGPPLGLSRARMLLKQSEHPASADIAMLKGNGIVDIRRRMQASAVGAENWSPAALFLVARDLFEGTLGTQRSEDLVHDIIGPAARLGRHIDGWKLPGRHWVRDMGTPEGFMAVERRIFWERRASKARSRASKPLTCMFLDRDGVLTEPYLKGRGISRLSLRPDAVEGVQHLNQLGVRVIVVTNQGSVARGMLDEAELNRQHNQLLQDFTLLNAKVDAIYYCPHHPETHHGEGITGLRKACECRKPRPGMIFKAAEELGIDLEQAGMIGDSDCDIEAGQMAGLVTGRIVDGAGAVERVQADYTAPSLVELVDAMCR